MSFFLALTVFISSVLAEDLCRKITTFNAVCQQGGFTFLLSVSPCLTDGNFNPLAFSIFHQKNQMFSSWKLLMHKEYYQLGSDVFLFMHVYYKTVFVFDILHEESFKN